MHYLRACMASITSCCDSPQPSMMLLLVTCTNRVSSFNISYYGSILLQVRAEYAAIRGRPHPAGCCMHFVSLVAISVFVECFIFSNNFSTLIPPYSRCTTCIVSHNGGTKPDSKQLANQNIHSWQTKTYTDADTICHQGRGLC